jgi:hypothetical protein
MDKFDGKEIQLRCVSLEAEGRRLVADLSMGQIEKAAFPRQCYLLFFLDKASWHR